MRRIRRYQPPDEVRRLVTTIEDFCEIQEGKRRPLKKIFAVTGIPKQTTSGWFCYEHFPRWETFEVFLGFFADPAHRRHLGSLWTQAWPAEQRARKAGPYQATARETTRTSGSNPLRWAGAVRGRLRGLGRHVGATVAAAVVAAILTALVDAGWRWWHGRPNSHAAAASQCAQVIVGTSPVFLNVGDSKPHKHKYKYDRVRLVDVPVLPSPRGVFAAVALPAPGESPTGHGWMPERDLVPTKCSGQRR